MHLTRSALVQSKGVLSSQIENMEYHLEEVEDVLKSKVDSCGCWLVYSISFYLPPHGGTSK